MLLAHRTNLILNPPFGFVTRQTMGYRCTQILHCSLLWPMVIALQRILLWRDSFQFLNRSLFV